jgi:anti-sigma-K factor RskA
VNDVPEGSQFESRLPDDPRYWDELATRIVDSAKPILRGQREAQAWWQPLAKWSPAIGVAAAIAALLVAAAGPPAAERQAPVSFAQLLSPDDPIARAVVSQAGVMDISAMLLVESGGQR